MPFPNVQSITDGEAASAAVFNRALQNLTTRTDYLKAAIDGLTLSDRLELTDVPIAPTVTPGMPVYLDIDNARFAPALAALEAQSGYNLADDRALWRGCCSSVSGAVGSVVLSGSLQLATAEWDAVVPGGSVPGRYFLSSEIAGRITRDPQGLAIYVGDLAADGRFYLAAQASTNVLQHQHLRADLSPDAAGSFITSSGSYVIDSPNASQRGWLPADSTHFPTADIPPGAAFGYNIQQADEWPLRRLFPPVPVDTAQFEQGSTLIQADRLLVNLTGIWWMTDDVGEAPWDGDGDIRYWTVRVPAAGTIVQLLTSQVLSEIAQNFGQLGIRTVNASQQTDFIAITVDQDGNAQFFNDGVHALRQGSGVRVTGTAGDAAAGRRHSVRVDDAVEHPLSPLYTTGPSTVVPIVGDGTAAAFVIEHNLGGALTSVLEYVSSIAGNDVDDTFVISHGLGTPFPSVNVWDEVAQTWVIVQIQSLNQNQLQVQFSSSPATGDSYRVVVIGGGIAGADNPFVPPVVNVRDQSNEHVPYDDMTVIDSNSLLLTFPTAPDNGEELNVRVTGRPRSSTVLPLATYDVPGNLPIFDAGGVAIEAGEESNWVYHLGTQLPAGEVYQPRLRLLLALDTPHSVTPVGRNISVRISRVTDGQPVTDLNTEVAVRQVEDGRPGQVQVTTVVPASLTAARGQTLFVRVGYGATNAPPSGSLRVISVDAEFRRI